ncbi:MAG: CoA transferase [Comamonadaceae bacterium]|nr:MAG: CoA transferase [Comamonadaceae bacterium]
MTGLPLEDITVIGIEQAVAAPLATRQLADLGARVIKIERPEGGDFARKYDNVVHGESSVFVWLNRGKESVELDLTSEAGQAVIHELLSRADVVVANLAPRALASLGLTTEQLCVRHPNLIVCTISGYDPDGPTPDKKAYDALIQAETGLMSLTGMPSQPAKVGISVADIAAGSFAYSGVLAALRHRDRTGEALPVHVSLFGALTEWMAYPLYYTTYGGTAPEPMGTAHPTIAPYGAVRTADGGSVMVAVQNDREWTRLCRNVIERPDLVDDLRFSSNSERVANRADLDQELAVAFAALTERALITRLEEAQIAWSTLNGVAELARHQELDTPKRWLDTDTPGGQVRTLAPTATPGGRCAQTGVVPGYGQHTAAILAEISGRKER